MTISEQTSSSGDGQPHLADSFPWLASALLVVEASEVIRLRLEKFARCETDANEEAELMVTEKVVAALEATAKLMAGATPASIVDRYREHVAANARRLSV